MIKKTVIAIILIILALYLFHLYDDYSRYLKLISETPKSISIESNNVKVTVDDSTTWDTVNKAIYSILATFLGIKVINKIL